MNDKSFNEFRSYRNVVKGVGAKVRASSLRPSGNSGLQSLKLGKIKDSSVNKTMTQSIQSFLYCNANGVSPLLYQQSKHDFDDWIKMLQTDDGEDQTMRSSCSENGSKKVRRSLIAERDSKYAKTVYEITRKYDLNSRKISPSTPKKTSKTMSNVHSTAGSTRASNTRGSSPQRLRYSRRIYITPKTSIRSSTAQDTSNLCTYGVPPINNTFRPFIRKYPYKMMGWRYRLLSHRIDLGLREPYMTSLWFKRQRFHTQYHRPPKSFFLTLYHGSSTGQNFYYYPLSQGDGQQPTTPSTYNKSSKGKKYQSTKLHNGSRLYGSRFRKSFVDSLNTFRFVGDESERISENQKIVTERLINNHVSTMKKRRGEQPKDKGLISGNLRSYGSKSNGKSPYRPGQSDQDGGKDISLLQTLHQTPNSKDDSTFNSDQLLLSPEFDLQKLFGNRQHITESHLGMKDTKMLDNKGSKDELDPESVDIDSILEQMKNSTNDQSQDIHTKFDVTNLLASPYNNDSGIPGDPSEKLSSRRLQSDKNLVNHHDQPKSGDNLTSDDDGKLDKLSGEAAFLGKKTKGIIEETLNKGGLDSLSDKTQENVTEDDKENDSKNNHRKTLANKAKKGPGADALDDPNVIENTPLRRKKSGAGSKGSLNSDYHQKNLLSDRNTDKSTDGRKVKLSSRGGSGEEHYYNYSDQVIYYSNEEGTTDGVSGENGKSKRVRSRRHRSGLQGRSKRKGSGKNDSALPDFEAQKVHNNTDQDGNVDSPNMRSEHQNEKSGKRKRDSSRINSESSFAEDGARQASNRIKPDNDYVELENGMKDVVIAGTDQDGSAREKLGDKTSKMSPNRVKKTKDSSSSKHGDRSGKSTSRSGNKSTGDQSLSPTDDALVGYSVTSENDLKRRGKKHHSKSHGEDKSHPTDDSAKEGDMGSAQHLNDQDDMKSGRKHSNTAKRSKGRQIEAQSGRDDDRLSKEDRRISGDYYSSTSVVSESGKHLDSRSKSSHHSKSKSSNNKGDKSKLSKLNLSNLDNDCDGSDYIDSKNSKLQHHSNKRKHSLVKKSSGSSLSKHGSPDYRKRRAKSHRLPNGGNLYGSIDNFEEIRESIIRSRSKSCDMTHRKEQRRVTLDDNEPASRSGRLDRRSSRTSNHISASDSHKGVKSGNSGRSSRKGRKSRDSGNKVDSKRDLLASRQKDGAHSHDNDISDGCHDANSAFADGDSKDHENPKEKNASSSVSRKSRHGKGSSRSDKCDSSSGKPDHQEHRKGGTYLVDIGSQTLSSMSTAIDNIGKGVKPSAYSRFVFDDKKGTDGIAAANNYNTESLTAGMDGKSNKLGGKRRKGLSDEFQSITLKDGPATTRVSKCRSKISILEDGASVLKKSLSMDALEDENDRKIQGKRTGTHGISNGITGNLNTYEYISSSKSHLRRRPSDNSMKVSERNSTSINTVKTWINTDSPVDLEEAVRLGERLGSHLKSLLEHPGADAKRSGRKNRTHKFETPKGRIKDLSESEQNSERKRKEHRGSGVSGKESNYTKESDQLASSNSNEERSSDLNNKQTIHGDDEVVVNDQEPTDTKDSSRKHDESSRSKGKKSRDGKSTESSRSERGKDLSDDKRKHKRHSNESADKGNILSGRDSYKSHDYESGEGGDTTSRSTTREGHSRKSDKVNRKSNKSNKHGDKFDETLNSSSRKDESDIPKHSEGDKTDEINQNEGESKNTRSRKSSSRGEKLDASDRSRTGEGDASAFGKKHKQSRGMTENWKGGSPAKTEPKLKRSLYLFDERGNAIHIILKERSQSARYVSTKKDDQYIETPRSARTVSKNAAMRDKYNKRSESSNMEFKDRKSLLMVKGAESIGNTLFGKLKNSSMVERVTSDLVLRSPRNPLEIEDGLEHVDNPEQEGTYGTSKNLLVINDDISVNEKLEPNPNNSDYKITKLDELLIDSNVQRDKKSENDENLSLSARDKVDTISILKNGKSKSVQTGSDSSLNHLDNCNVERRSVNINRPSAQEEDTRYDSQSPNNKRRHDSRNLEHSGVEITTERTPSPHNGNVIVNVNVMGHPESRGSERKKKHKSFTGGLLVTGSAQHSEDMTASRSNVSREDHPARDKNRRRGHSSVKPLVTNTLTEESDGYVYSSHPSRDVSPRRRTGTSKDARNYTEDDDIIMDASPIYREKSRVKVYPHDPSSSENKRLPKLSSKQDMQDQGSVGHQNNKYPLPSNEDFPQFSDRADLYMNESTLPRIQKGDKLTMDKETLLRMFYTSPKNNTDGVANIASTHWTENDALYEMQTATIDEEKDAPFSHVSFSGLAACRHVNGYIRKARGHSNSKAMSSFNSNNVVDRKTLEERITELTEHNGDVRFVD